MEEIICYFICFLVEGFIFWQYTSVLFPQKNDYKFRSITLFLLFFTLYIINFLRIFWLNCLAFVFVCFCYLIIFYKVKWYSALFHSIIFEALTMIFELPTYSLIIRFFPDYNFQMTGPYNKILFTIISKASFFIIMSILIYILKKKHEPFQQVDYSALFTLLVPFITLLIVLILFAIFDSSTLTTYQNRLITLSAFFLLVVNLLIFGLNQYNQQKHLEYTEMQLQLQKEHDSAEYYKMLIAQNENQRILIHDIKKHLQSIALLNEESQNEKIRVYINQLMQSSDLMEFSRLCDHKILNNILCRYKKVCTDMHISFHTDIRSNTTTFLSDTDVTSLFCNLLDNAVEAANHIRESYIEINAAKREHTPFVVITMINSCAKNPFSKNGELISSKKMPQAHGFGMKSIEKIVHKYNGNMQTYYDETTCTFHTIIMLKRPE